MPGSRDGSSPQAEHWELPGAALGLRWVHRERPWASDIESGQRPASPKAWVEEQMPTPANTRSPLGVPRKGCEVMHWHLLPVNFVVHLNTNLNTQQKTQFVEFV